ncbi:MAG: glycoside hydrolase family 2 TIM barrel-domain containing protein [Paludibacter sp.]|nr:glycoside hydrolase family 2 TIM barrel-domain containing protein [Paludibacter sp.]
MNIRKIFSVVVSLLAMNLLHAQASFGKSEKINDSWKFTLSDPAQAQTLNFNDSQWRILNLPHDWSVEGTLSPANASCMGYLPGGIGWYRKSLEIPEEYAGQKIYLYFEGVYNRSEVFINGQLLGERPNGYISFMYDATPYIKYGQKNLIAVRVDHSKSADSRWYTGSGIYRNVWLIHANPVHIKQWGVYTFPTNVSAKQAVVNVEVEVDNGTNEQNKFTIRNELLSATGEIVAVNTTPVSVVAGQINKAVAKLKVRRPELWNLEHPYLYQLKTTVLKDGEIIDQTFTKTGIRSYTFDPDKGFALNGTWMKVKGVCLHHDAGVLGAAVPREVWKRRLLTLKETGCNAIRTTHNPQAPDLYDLCDELGILVLNEAFDEWEFPKRKWLEGWNVGTPGFQGSTDFFEEWGEKDLADMVKRDRNHVSVFAWSIGNEVDYPNDPYSHPVLDGGGNTGFTQAVFGGYKKDAPDANRLGVIAKRLAKVVREFDKTRPVTAGLAGVAMSNQTEYPAALDITGYNYTEGRYAEDHKTYPDRIIFGSENRHDIAAWDSVKNNDYIFGQFLWTGIDYLGESGTWPSRGFYSGLLDFAGFMKPRGYFRQSLWSDKPMAYIGTYPLHKKAENWSVLEAPDDNENLSIDAWPFWNYDEGQLVRVVCYTNTAKARLELNGNIVGAMKNYDDKTGIIYWDIPFSPGKLEVVGFSQDNQAKIRYFIQSSERPYAITASVYEKTVKPDDVIQIMLQIVDEQGIPVMNSDNEITCNIAGSAKLLGMEAGNNSDMGDYRDNKQRVFHGKILAYIQSTGEKGEIKINFSSPWLKSAELNVEIK